MSPAIEGRWEPLIRCWDSVSESEGDRTLVITIDAELWLAIGAVALKSDLAPIEIIETGVLTLINGVLQTLRDQEKSK